MKLAIKATESEVSEVSAKQLRKYKEHKNKTIYWIVKNTFNKPDFKTSR
jgi:hypothetical protein